MHTEYIKFSLILIFSATLITSCVTRKKYDDLNIHKSKIETEKADCDEKLKSAMAESEKLSAQVNDMSKSIAVLTGDTSQTNFMLRKTQKNLSEIYETYERLLKNHDRLQTNSSAETQKLHKDITQREREIIDSEKKIKDLQTSLQERETRVKELEQVLDAKEKAVNDLKTKVSKALLSFKEKDLTVNVKNGKVYVSLAEQLLFKSGSIAVDPKGVEAIKKLADVLKEQQDISIMVEGHTDDVPLSKGTNGIADNWDLSVLRATSIVRILTNAGVSTKTLLPAGRGESTPVAEGKTAEARQKNRRTEIIITPKLDELFQILGTN